MARQGTKGRLAQAWRAALAGGLALAAGACVTMPGEKPLPGALPQAWRDAPAPAAAGSAGLINWWEGFHNPTLSALVAEGLARGPSAQIAALRVKEARAASRATVAQYLPALTATGGGQYRRVESGPGLPAASGGLENEQATASYGAQISWEVPLFQLGPALAGARASARKAAADERGVLVALAADIAQAYVELRAAQASARALEESVANSDRLAGILDVGARAGLTAGADAADARRQAESARARLPGFAIEARRAETVLSVLRGYAPGADTAQLQAALGAVEETPALALTAAPAAPADLVRLRPDVAGAEQQALIAAAALGGARADLLPRLNLTGALSVTNNAIGNALPGRVVETTASPLISLPLFDWGQRFAAVGQRNAQFQQALIQYRDTVNKAVAEATNALASLDQGAKRLEAAGAAETAAEATLRGRRAAYGAGVLSLVDLLRAEQQAIDARLARIDAQSQAAHAAIAVYRAFGGGPPGVIAEIGAP